MHAAISLWVVLVTSALLVPSLGVGMIVITQPGGTFGERAVAWLLEAVSLLFGPNPGSQAHVDALFDTLKQRNEELSKPAEQRDEARLLQLTRRRLRLLAERCEASFGRRPSVGWPTLVHA